jgi:hypothetical protein
VARVANAEVLNATNGEVPDEVDDNDEDEFADEEFRDMWQRTHHIAGEDMGLMARVMMGTVRARHQLEAREAAAFHEAAIARAEVDALVDAAAEGARARAVQAHAEEATQRAHSTNALAEGQVRRVAEELHSQRATQRAEARMLELTPRDKS